MKKIKQKMKLVFIILLLSGCNGGCEFPSHSYRQAQIAILNNTKDTIKFYFSDISYFLYLEDSIVVCKPYSENILEDYIVSYAKDIVCHPFIERHTDLIITVTTSSGRTLIKDIKKNSNWYCAENSRSLWKVVFEINEEDLE